MDSGAGYPRYCEADLQQQAPGTASGRQRGVHSASGGRQARPQGGRRASTPLGGMATGAQARTSGLPDGSGLLPNSEEDAQLDFRGRQGGGRRRRNGRRVAESAGRSRFEPRAFRLPDLDEPMYHRPPLHRNPRIASAYQPLHPVAVLASNFTNLRAGTGPNMDPAARLQRQRRKDKASQQQ